jgi:hypothetical protein
MKRYIFTLLILIFFLPYVNSQTDGQLDVSITTSSAGGVFTPRNIVAVWVEDESGNFVKTLLAYAQSQKTHLNTWQASTKAAGSEYNIVDAISGPTKSNHTKRNCSWNATDVDGNIVADGTYVLWMELTDKNSTGNFSSFNFIKGSEAESKSPDDVPSFSLISIEWTPSTTDIEEFNGSDLFTIYPNPSKGILNIAGDDFDYVEVRNISGSLIFKSFNKTIDLSDQPEGIYLLKLKTQKGSVTRKIIKQ